MSRHRNVRSMNYYDDEYYDDDDDYSRSFEDNYCISPGTVAQFTWNRERSSNLASCMGADEVINEVEEEEENDKVGLPLNDSLNASQARSNLNDTDKALLNSCLEEIHNIMGESVPESIMVETILRNRFSVEKSLNELLSPQDVPKPQRQPRIRNRSQDDSDDTNELNKLLADIQSLESITKAGYHAPAFLRFKSNPGSDEADSGFEFTDTNLKDSNMVSKSEVEVLLPQKSSIPGSRFSVLMQKEGNELSSIKPKASLTELAKESNSTKDVKPACNILRSEPKIISNVHSQSHSDKPCKVSLADLEKRSKDKKETQNKLCNESNVGSSISELSRSFDDHLIVHSSQDIKASDSGKFSLADLAKQHKSNKSVPWGHKMKLETSSSAFIVQHLADKKEQSSQSKTSSLPGTLLYKESTIGVVKTASPHASLSELANQHKNTLHCGVKTDSKLGALTALADSHRLSYSQSAKSDLSATGMSAKMSGKVKSDVRSAEKSLAKLSLTSCLRSSKQNSESLRIGKVNTHSEYVSDFTQIVSVDDYKENKDLSPVSVIEKVDMSLVSLPSNSAIVFCNIMVRGESNCGAKRKMSYPSFACHKQTKKRKILYPQQKMHHISAFNFSTMSPDDIVKKKQKQAFMRSDKEFNIGNSSHS